jgi:hypothetical protein
MVARPTVHVVVPRDCVALEHLDHITRVVKQVE